jgi:hypothetical protein
MTFEQGNPAVYIWLPAQSATGQYEALVGEELVQETNGRRFLSALKQKVHQSGVTDNRR